MKLQDQIKEAISDRIVEIGYNDRMDKIARDGMDDIANIDYTDVVARGTNNDGTLTKQAADETVTREIRRQIVAAGYYNALNNE